MLQSPGPTSLFVPLEEGKLVSIGSGTSSDLRLPGTALNHITINGIDKLLSNGNTEVALNGAAVVEEVLLVHGDILQIPSYKLIYLDPAVDIARIKQLKEAKAAENSNTESAEEEARKSGPSSPIIKPNIKPKAQFKHNADAIWKKRIAEAAFEVCPNFH